MEEIDVELLKDIRKLCHLITCSPSDTPIKGEIESLAFMIGHYQQVLNIPESKVDQNSRGQS